MLVFFTPGSGRAGWVKDCLNQRPKQYKSSWVEDRQKILNVTKDD